MMLRHLLVTNTRRLSRNRPVIPEPIRVGPRVVDEHLCDGAFAPRSMGVRRNLLEKVALAVPTTVLVKSCNWSSTKGTIRNKTTY